VNLSRKVIYRAIDDRELPAYKLRGQIRIRRSDFDAWIEARRVPGYPVPDLEP
jgi:excisionase family DNA binding protein